MRFRTQNHYRKNSFFSTVEGLSTELEEPVELDEMELEKYIEFVVREVRKGSKP